MVSCSEPDPGATVLVTREQVLAYRFAVQQLDRRQAAHITDAAVLDIGVQDTGPDGAGWALTIRGVDPVRRQDTGPTSSSPGPTVKGTVSAELSSRLEAPYLRQCRPCDAIHTYEQPFRLAALRVGLELQQGTSPPALQRIPRWRGAAQRVAPRLDVIRAYLHLLGPATYKSVAAYLDAPVTDVEARWPPDVTSVSGDGERRWMLAGDVDMLAQASMDPATVRLLGP